MKYVETVIMLSMLVALTLGFCKALDYAAERTLTPPSVEQLRHQQRIVARWEDNEYVSLVAAQRKGRK